MQGDEVEDNVSVMLCDDGIFVPRLFDVIGDL